MIKLFFKKFFIAIAAILLILLCGVIGLGLLLLIIWLLSIAKWLAAPAIIIIMALVYASVETYQDWQKEQFNAIKKKKEHYEEKLISCVKHWEKAENETECQYWAEEKDRYCNLINESQDKLKKLLEKMEK